METNLEQATITRWNEIIQGPNKEFDLRMTNTELFVIEGFTEVPNDTKEMRYFSSLIRALEII